MSRNLDFIYVGMKELSVEDLLLNMSYRESDPKGADESFKELYRRYSRRLTQAVNGILKNKDIYNPDLAKSTVNNVFVEISQKPLNFNYDKNNNKSEDTAFKAWMYTIARNELADLMKESIKFSDMHAVDVEDEIIENMAEIEIEQDILSGNRQLLDKALSVLSVRDRAILLEYFDCYVKGKNTPTEVLDMMCEYWGTTRDNARQIKKRALAKVKKQIEQLVELKTTK